MLLNELREVKSANNRQANKRKTIAMEPYSKPVKQCSQSEPAALALRGGRQLVRSGEHVPRQPSMAEDAPDGRMLGIAALELRGVFECDALSRTQL